MRIAWVALVSACSIPPFAGHDEDGDGIRDEDDPCPHIAGPDGSIDSDGDGIGDACDPAPNDPGDHKLFYAFAGGHGDLYVDGVVADADDAIDIGTRSGDTTSFAWVPDEFTDVRVDIAFEVIGFDVGNASSYNELSLRSGHPPSQVIGSGLSHLCDVGRMDDATSYHDDGDANSSFEFHILQIPYDGFTGHLSVTQHLGYRCTLDGVAGLDPSTLHPSNAPMYVTGQVGVSAHNVIARIRYLFVAGR